MAIAAVPKYLGQDFFEASPGLRFGLFLKIWDEGCIRPSAQAKTDALKEAAKLNGTDQKALRALADRQKGLAAAQRADQILTLKCKAIAPFTTGLGNEHPLENGFAFLNPYGLPYLPGSGVKGVLRQAARELMDGMFSNDAGWTQPNIDALFGKDAKSADAEHQRGALCFWDVIPQIQGDKLKVEVMTPHQSHYYQSDRSPHESGQPNPINFLTVPPGSEFSFHVQCDLTFLAHAGIAPHLAKDGAWKELLKSAFEHAFEWLGFGAKTAVGYGSMDLQAPPPPPVVIPPIIWQGAQVKRDKSSGKIIFQFGGKQALLTTKAAQDWFRGLNPELVKKLEKEKLKATVSLRVNGNNYEVLSAEPTP